MVKNSSYSMTDERLGLLAAVRSTVNIEKTALVATTGAVSTIQIAINIHYFLQEIWGLMISTNVNFEGDICLVKISGRSTKINRVNGDGEEQP